MVRSASAIDRTWEDEYYEQTNGVLTRSSKRPANFLQTNY